MCDLTLVLLAAGNSTRLNLAVKKQWLRIADNPLWLVVANRFEQMDKFSQIIIVANDKEIPYMRAFGGKFSFVCGGNSRQESLQNALAHVKSEFVAVSDIARAGVAKDMVDRLIQAAPFFDCTSPYISAVDTSYLGDNVINRDEIKLIQTPQISRTNLLIKALEEGQEFSDDSTAIKSVNGRLGFVLGDEKALKITHQSDLAKFGFPPPLKSQFSATGYDVHKFGQERELVLCGVSVPHHIGLIAHSDGDVGLHALVDALLGASGLGDIGELFPDSAAEFKNANSADLLHECVRLVNSVGFEIVNVDLTLILERPKISNFKPLMRERVANILGIKPCFVNIKATTSEGLGFVGRQEGIAAMASANLKFFDWTCL